MIKDIGSSRNWISYIICISGDSLAIDLISEHSEDVLVGQTLKRPLLPHLLADGKKHTRDSLEHARSLAFVSTAAYEQSN